MYDFLETYYPAIADVDPTRVAAVRSRLELLLRSAYPDVDTSPNSVFGDLDVSPRAWGTAGVETGLNRFMQDLDPEFTAEGTTWNCPYVRQYLKNFGIFEPVAQNSYGILRLTFSSNTLRQVDRSTRFQMSGNIYRPYLPYEGPLVLVPPGDLEVAGQNYRSYIPVSENGWAIDIIVEGASGFAPTAGSSASVDRVIDGLVSASALANFSTGVPVDKVQQLAIYSRATFHSRTPSTRGGARSYLTQRFPSLNIISPVISGDVEMKRDVMNPATVAAGRMDVLVRSAEVLTDTVRLELDYIPVTAGPESAATRRFVGKLAFPETAVRVVSVVHEGTPVAFEVISVSKDPDRAPALTAAYGHLEQLWVDFEMPYDVSTPLVDIQIDGSRQFGIFDVVYQFDPALKIAQEAMTAGDAATVGLDTYVKWFTPVLVSDLDVIFNRKAGTSLDLDTARQEILTTYNSSFYDSPATPAMVADSMFYAGAHSVKSVTLTGTIAFSPASKVFTATDFIAPVDATTYADFVDGLQDVPVQEITSAYEPQIDVVDTEGTLAVSGPRNTTYLIASANLNLIENKSV